MTFKTELERVKNYIEQNSLAEADMLLRKIKKEYETIKSLKAITPGTSKSKEEIDNELKKFIHELDKVGIYDCKDLITFFNLFRDRISLKESKEMLEERISRIKKYLQLD